MIELIFVIVILGILAAVAIPKLAATRDDAKISKGLSEISTAINDFGAYYTSRGSFSTIQNMTNVSSWDDPTTEANVSTGTATVNYITPDNSGSDENCVLFTFTPDGNVTVTPVSSPSGNICVGIQSSNTFLNDLNGTKTFGGKRVTF